MIEDSDDITPAVRTFLQTNPVYYDDNGLWWAWNGNVMAWEKVDETTIVGRFEATAESCVDLAKSAFQTLILSRMRIDGRKKRPHLPNGHEVQFGTKIYDVRNGEAKEPTPSYFFVNVLPWEAGANDDTPTINRLFAEWVGPENVQKLVELCAFCCLPDYPIQVIFALVGGGNNGKTTFLNFLKKFVGERNTVAARLDALVQSGGRFESAVLYRKLVCTMGETNVGLVRNTSYLKDLSGGDDVTFEFKGKTPFTAKNYAKIVISSNSLPMTTDKTRGYLRRWLIIDFPNNFDGKEKRYPLDEIPEAEWGAFSTRCLNVLKDLLKRGSFVGEGSIEERMKRYEDASNPVMAYLRDHFDETPDYAVSYPFSRFCAEYKAYCELNKRRVSSAIEVGRVLRAEGWEVEHQNISRDDGSYTTQRMVLGLRPINIPNTHNTLFALIDKSFENIGVKEKRVLSGISVFTGKCAHCGTESSLSLDHNGNGSCAACRKEGAV